MLVNFKATRYSLASLCQHRVSYFTTTTNLYNNLNNNNYSPLIYTAMLHWYNGGLSFPHRKVARLSSVLQTCLGWGRWCFFFRTGGYPWCCQNGHFGVPWTKWGEGRKKTWGGVQEENAWNAEILEWIAWRVMAATFWDVVYICSIDPLHLCRTRKLRVLGLAGATCTWGDQAAIRDRKKRKLVGKGRSWTEVAKKSVTREAEWSKAS